METIAEAFAGNARVREKLRSLLADVEPGKLTHRPDGEEWSIQEIVEHIAIVDEGTARICSKLVSEARDAGLPGSGKLELSEAFSTKTAAAAGVKLQAPERVRPTGSLTIADSFAKMDETRKVFDAMLPDLEKYDLSGPKFPHPYFGPLTAAEWLVIAGGHERRHVEQIERLVSKL